MKPTIEHLYSNPEFFIKLYEEAGMEHARAKISSLNGEMAGYLSMKRYHATTVRDRNQRLRQLNPTDTEYTAFMKRRHNNILIFKKNVNNLSRTEVYYRNHIARRSEYIYGRMAKWPEINYTVKEMMAFKKTVKVRRMRGLKFRGVNSRYL
jgi:hypothetical protein